MPLTAAQLQIVVNAQTDQAKAGLSEMNDQVQKSSGFFKEAVGSMLGFVGGQLIFAGIQKAIGLVTDTLSSMVDEAGALQTAESQLNAVLASTHDASGMSAQAINDLADSMEQMSGVSKSTILQGQNMLLTFTGIGKDTFPLASQAMLNMAIAMNGGSTSGLDLKNTAIQLGKALNDPLTGMTALTREGVTFSDKEKELIKHFMAVGDVADAQKVMLQELQTEFGGSAKAAGSTFGGALDKVKNIIVDLGANALMKLEDWIQPWLTAFGNWLPGALDTAGKFLGKLFAPLSQLHLSMDNISKSPLIAAMHKFADGILSAALPAARQFSGWFQSTLAPVIKQVAPIFLHLGDVIVNQLAPAWLAFTGSVDKAIVTVGARLMPIFEKVMPILVKLEGFIAGKLSAAIQFLTPYIRQAAAEVGKFGNEIAQRVTPVVNNLIKFIDAAIPVVQTIWNAVWPTLSAVLKGVWDVIVGIIQVAWSIIKGIFEVALDLLGGKWGQAWTDIKTMVSGVFDGIIKIFHGFWEEVSAVWGAIWNGIKSVAEGAWNGITSGISNAFTGIKNTITGIMEGAKNIFKGAINWVISGIDKLIDAWDSIKINIPSVSIGPVTIGGGSIGLPHIPDIPLLAAGGTISRTGWAIVGEKGPEVVALPKGAQVYPNNSSATQGALGTGAGMTPVILQVDGKQLAKVLMPHMPGVIANATGVRNF
jgi:phage-related protein